MNAVERPATLPVVLVLASGRGERFAAAGGLQHKLQAPLAGVPVLERTLGAVRASGLPWHLEDAGHPGMGDTIAAAVRATAHAPGWLVLPGDLPLVAPDSLLAVADAVRAGPAAVVAPFHAGERGHPVGFSAACRDALLALSGDHGAAAVVRAHEALGAVCRIDLPDPGIVADIDTPADLARVEALLARNAR